MWSVNDVQQFIMKIGSDSMPGMFYEQDVFGMMAGINLTHLPENMVFQKSSHSESCLFGFKISWLFQHSLIICEVSVWYYRRRIWCFKTWQATRQQYCRDLSDKTIRKYQIQICWFREFSITYNKTLLYCTEALKGHRVLWKIEVCHLIRMT